MHRLLLFLCLLPLKFHGQSYDAKLALVREISAYHQSMATNADNRLIDLSAFIPGIVLDIRYATDNNFTGKAVYTQAKAWVRFPLAVALKEVQDELKKQGLGLLIYDAYRPYAATLAFYEIVRDTNFVAAPWRGSRHNRGAAVDVGLVELESGRIIEMPTLFDDFSERAHIDFMDLPDEVIANRARLVNLMSAHGFDAYPYEWWHFDFKGWEAFDLMDLSFEELEQQAPAGQ